MSAAHDVARPTFRAGVVVFLLGAAIVALIVSSSNSKRPTPIDKAPRFVHVFVALCDNENQGIVKVPEQLGDGQDPANNLYWGAMYGVKTFFTRSDHWTVLSTSKEKLPDAILKRCIFKLKQGDDASPVYVVADAYDGAKMHDAMIDFLSAAAGKDGAVIKAGKDDSPVELKIGGSADLVCFVGHNGLMDEDLAKTPARNGKPGPAGAVVLACKSKPYFEPLLKRAGCTPVVMTTGFMAPEAYVLDAALRAWADGKPPNEVRLSAAAAYAKYQKCSTAAANRLFDAE